MAMAQNRPGSCTSTFLVCGTQVRLFNREGEECVRTNRDDATEAGQAVAQQGPSGLVAFSVNHIQKLDVGERCREQEGSAEWGKPGPVPALARRRQRRVSCSVFVSLT